VRRLFGIVVLAGLVAGLAYGLVVTRREAAYRQYIEQGDAALGRDDSNAAIEAFSVALSWKPDSMAAHLKRGEAYRRRNEFDAALRDLREAADLDPLATYPQELLGDVYYARALADGDSAAVLFRRAVECYRQGVELDDRSARVQYKLGLASYRAGQLPAAIGALRQALRLDSRLAEAHYTLGICLRASRQTSAAVASLERAVALAPTLLAAREELADVYGALGRHEARLTHLEALLTLQPGAARERALGLGYASAGQLDRAVGQLSHAVQRYPEDAATFVAVGRVWLERAAGGGRVELGKALEALQRATGNDSSSEALTLLGRALLLAGDLPRAQQVLEQAAGRFPVDPEAFRYLSEVAERRGLASLAQRALLDYVALVRTEALRAPLLARLGEVHMRRGDMEGARRAIDAALDKDPGNRLALGLKGRLR
jgi:tetratricopeptide (TPR) repeat protein